MPPRKPPPGAGPEQAAWMQHMGIIDENPMRSPKPKAPSPQQKALAELLGTDLAISNAS